jgi:hypothetical protein
VFSRYNVKRRTEGKRNNKGITPALSHIRKRETQHLATTSRRLRAGLPTVRAKSYSKLACPLFLMYVVFVDSGTFAGGAYGLFPLTERLHGVKCTSNLR